MTLEELKQAEIAMTEKLEVYRGRILNATIEIERLIELIITHYFVRDDETRRNQLLEAVIHQNRFSTNVELISYIQEKQPDLFEDATTNLNANLKAIMEFRNKIAHQSAEINGTTVEAYDNQTISLFRINKKKGIQDTKLNHSVVNGHLTMTKETRHDLAMTAHKLGAIEVI